MPLVYDESKATHVCVGGGVYAANCFCTFCGFKWVQFWYVDQSKSLWYICIALIYKKGGRSVNINVSLAPKCANHLI